MNDTFDINRLWRLLRYETLNYVPRFLKSLLIFASVIVAVWLFAFTNSNHVPADDREGLIEFFLILAIMLSPFIVYKDMNNRKKGYMYAMIPASTLEKLLSMVILCSIVVPLLAYLVLTATDSMLFLLSRIGIGTFYGFALCNPFANSFGPLVLGNSEIVDFSVPVLDSLLPMLQIIFYSMMFNVIFRKNKVLKTILFNIAMFFAFVLLMVSVADSMSIDNLYDKLLFSFENEDEFIRFWLNAGRVTGVLFSALCLVVTYFRIKRVNY